MRLILPCNKCLVRAACKLRCQEVVDYNSNVIFIQAALFFLAIAILSIIIVGIWILLAVNFPIMIKTKIPVFLYGVIWVPSGVKLLLKVQSMIVDHIYER